MLDDGEPKTEVSSGPSLYGRSLCKEGLGTDPGSGMLAELRIFENSAGILGGGKLTSSCVNLGQSRDSHPLEHVKGHNGVPVDERGRPRQSRMARMKYNYLERLCIPFLDAHYGGHLTETLWEIA